MRRSLAAALWLVTGLVAATLGGWSALIGSDSGRALLTQVARGTLRSLVDGSIEIDAVSGPLLTGVTLKGVRVLDARRNLVATVPTITAAYDPFDFITGRFVLLGLVLDHPVVDLVQHRDGALNLAEIFRLGPHSGARGPSPLILFRNVDIEDGAVSLRLWQGGAPGAENGQGLHEFERVNARLPLVRLAGPGDAGVRLDLARLAVVSSDPRVDVRDAVGRLRVAGDSVVADLSTLDLPRSRLAARGTVRWGAALTLDLRVEAESLRVGDAAFLLPRLPPSTVCRGRARIRSHGPKLLEVRLDPVQMRYGAGALAGRMGFLVAADSGLVALAGVDVVADDVDLDLPRGLLDTLPLAGRLSGRTTADGPVRRLAVAVDWDFRDSLAAGARSQVHGQGRLNMRGTDGLGFAPFTVQAATVSLATVRQLVPGMALRGDLRLAGSLTGALHNALFTGRVVQEDGARPASVVDGSIALDTRDTLIVAADVRAESLSFEGLRGSFPNLPLQGAATGNIRVHGPLTALDTRVDLASAGGGVTGAGILTLQPSGVAVRGLTLSTRNLDLARWIRRGPSSRLNASLGGAWSADSDGTPVGAVAATLRGSTLAGAAVDSGRADVRFAEGRLYVDSLRVSQPGLVTTAGGALGWRRPVTGVLSVDFDADSLNALDSLLDLLAGPNLAAAGATRALRGSARVALAIEGALDSLAFDAHASTTQLEWRSVTVPGARGHAVFEPGPVPVFSIDASIDSLTLGSYGLADLVVKAQGTRDSLTWFGHSRLGALATVLGGGRATRAVPGDPPAPVTLTVDSLALVLPGGVWRSQSPIHATMSDSGLWVGSGALAPQGDSTRGEIAFEGTVPTRGPLEAHAEVEGLPLAGVYALLDQDTAGVGGTLNVSIALGGSRVAPVYHGSLSLANGSLGEFRTPYVDGTFSYEAQRLAAELHVWRAGQQVLNLTAALPLDLALVPVADRELPDTLSVQARADSVDLSVLEALTPLLREVRGVFSADVGIGGTWADPRLRGGVHLAGAAASIPTLNVRYEDLVGDLTLSGDTIAVRSLSVRSDKGRADVSGIIQLEELLHPRLALRINADQFKALDLRNQVTVTASGDLTLSGPVIGATLSGRATVTTGVLYFADLIDKRVVDLTALTDTSLAAVIAHQGLGPAFESVFLDSLRIQNLDLDMGSGVWLRSNEANIQLTGRMSLTKDGKTYLMSGTLNAPRGVYRLKVGPVTREFVVARGTVTFFGTPDLDAALDVEATRTVHPVPTATQRNPEDVVVVADITGTLLVPRVMLSVQNQDLSQSDVISYLLFGTPSFQLSGNQGGITDQQALLQSAADVLSGEFGRSLVSDLGIPLDYVEIRPGAPGAANDPLAGVELAVGRQLGRNTFLVVNAGFCQGRPLGVTNTIGLSLQYRLSPEFRTEASFEPVLTCTSDPLEETPSTTVPRQVGFDLIWERRY